MPRGRTLRRSRLVVPATLVLAATLALVMIAPYAQAAAPAFPVVAAGDDAWSVAGASHHDGHRGAAYVHRRDGGRWVLDATLAPPERQGLARFGAAVAIAGDRVVVGAPWDDGWHGAAYVYERARGAWRLAARLAPAGAVGDRFGAAVALDGGTVTLTAHDGTTARFALVDGEWRETGRVRAAAPGAPAWKARADLREPLAALDARFGGPSPAILALDPPATVRASDGIYEDRAEVRWSSVPGGPLLYKIYRRLASEPPSANVLIRVASQDDSLFSDVTGRRGTTYTYCVSVVDMNGDEGATRCDDGSRALFAPTGFTASDATFEDFVRLRWSDRSNVESAYRIRRDGALLSTELANTEVYDDTTAVPGVTYSYSLVAVDAAGDTTAPAVDSGESAFIAAPLGVAATDGQDPGKVVITWQDATTLEVSYRVYRNAGLLVTLPAGSVSYEDATAVFGTTYTYCVAAVDASARESARGCDTGGIGVLPAPTSVTATDDTFDDKVRVTWVDPSATEDGYLVYRMPSGTTDSILVANLGAGVTEFEDTGGEHGVLYTYCVVAFSNAGGRSAPVCDDGRRAIVLAPANVAATDDTFEDRVDLTWESTSSTVVLFKIYRGATFIRSVPAQRRSYSDDGGPSGVTLEYRVTALNAVGVESAATSDNGSRRIAAPVSVKASDQEFEDGVTLSWTDRSAIETGYFVYRSEVFNTTDPRTRIAYRPANSTSYTDRTGVPGQEYDYFVTAFQAYGPGRADTTESDAGTNDGSRALAVPTVVEATDGAFEDRIEVTWVDNSRVEEAYHVWRRNLTTDDSLRIAVLPPNANRHVDATTVFGVHYEYTVYAVDSAGVAMLGRSAPGRDEGSTTLLPPSGVSASEVYEDRVAIAWIDESALDTGYRITRDGVEIGTAPASATSFVDNSAVTGVQYTYCVQSVSGVNASQAVCDAGQRAASTADVSPIAFTDLPGVVYNLAFDGFGTSLDGEGDWLIVGAPGRQYWPGAGPVYFGRGAVVALRQDGFGGILSGGYSPFTGSGGSVDLGVHNTTATLFGQDVAISGDWLFATYNVGNADWVAILRQDYPSPWALVHNKSLGTVNTGFRGVRVDVSGTVAVFGMPGFGAQFLELTGGPAWGNTSFIPGDLRSVAISGNVALLGGSGTVRVATNSGGWSVTQTLTPPSPDGGFGVSVDVQGDRAVVGSSGGVAYVYERDGGGVWQPTGMLQPDRAGTSFGNSVSIRGTTILVGGGTVYVFELANGAWNRREVLGGPSGCFRCVQSVGQRGYSVRVIDGLIAAGDPSGSNDNNQNYIESRVYPLVAPVAPPGQVSATDNTYRDKVQITWTDESTTEIGFRVYRDAELIATLDPNIRIYSDFDAAPGRTYEYCVTAIIDSASRPPGAIAVESVRTCDFGRRPPDGNITGRVSTLSGAGVSGVNVCLDPAPNRSILFDGSGGTVTVTDGAVFGGEVTTEFWYRGHGSTTATLLAYSTQSTADVFALKNPTNLTLFVNGAPHPTGVAIDDGAWHHVAVTWNRSGGGLNVYKDGLPAYANLFGNGQTLALGGSLVLGAGLSGALDDIRVWDHVRSQAQIQASMPEFLEGNESGLAAYWPLNDSQSSGVEELKGNRYGRLSGGVHWITEAPPMNACAVSDVQGNYVLPNLRYGTSTTFKVTPSTDGHQFTPAFKTITLSTGNPVQNEVGYNDITSFTVAGTVKHRNSSCAATGVEIYVDGTLRGTTDANGRYAVPVSPGAHTIEPRLTGHTFLPASLALTNVVADVAAQDFTETTQRRLSGVVAGGCDIRIGTLTIRIDSEDGCFTRTIDAFTGYDEVLPPLKYFVRVTNVTEVAGGPDPAEVLQFFDDLGVREVDLSSADQTLDFVYRAPLRVVVSGLPPVNPGCPLGVPVVPQLDRYVLTISVVEDYGTLGTCPVDSGEVTVFDELLDQERNPVTLVVRDGRAYVSTENGLAPYITAGNTPNIFAGREDAQGNDRSYQKSLTVIADLPGREPVTETVWAIVTGHRPRTATFTSVSDGIPLTILRDPPGDRSSSFMAKDSTFCTSVSNLGMQSVAGGFEASVQTGIQFIVGFGFMTPTVAKVFLSGGLEIGFEAKQGGKFGVCAKTTEEFRTSAENAFIGRDGDVYVGLGLNVIFAKTDVVRVQGCSVVTSEEVTIGVDDVETVYSYTEGHIRNTVIPQLEELAVRSPADSVRFRGARQNWEDHIALNDSLKTAAVFERNRSFSAGSEFTYSSTVEETQSSSWSVNVFTNAELAKNFEFKVAGSGVELKWYTKLKFAYERSGETSVSRTRTTGYTLADDDVGDFFSVNVKKDPFFGTPVFDLLAGTSSCPWEPWPHPQTGAPRTQSRDAAQLSVEPPGRFNIDPNGRAEFVLTMTNTNPAEESREYFLMPVQAANPDGASIFVGGDTFIQLPFFLRYGEATSVSLTIVRGPTAYLYEDLQLVLIPVCEFDYWRNTGIAQLADTVNFTVRFKAPCSDITLLRPNTNWSVQAGSDSLELILTDFAFEVGDDDSLGAVGAEYQRAGSDVWLPIGSEVARASLPRNSNGSPRSLRLVWDVTHVPDGTYTVRGFTRCDQGRNYSASATGVIDRAAPQVFGTPQPSDGTLSFGEDISITFNEDVDCESADEVSVRLDLLGGPSPVPLAAPVTCNDRTLVIAPSTDLSAYEGSEIRATVTGIRDRSGNPSGTTIWTFTVRKGEFAWAQAEVSQDQPFGAGGRIAVNLVNGLGSRVAYTLGALPAWLTVAPAATDTIPAKSQTEVELVVAPDLALGAYDATVVATAVTDPPTTPRTATLEVHVNVVRVAPSWTVDPADFEHGMTVRAQVFAGADSLVDPETMLAAFVGDQVRGVARPQLVADGWRFFLTVYGKPPAYERVRFRVWDATTSRTWIATDKTLRFVADTTIGGYGAPLEIRTRIPSPVNEQVIPVSAGWTWFSVNRRAAASDDRTVAAVLGNLLVEPGDLVKAQDGSIATFDAVAGWIGTLDTLGVTKSYRLRAALPGEIRYESAPVLPSANPVTVRQGWNWIGYTPGDARPPASALAALVSAAGDVLRSQSAFAEYGASSWDGSLAAMAPGQGYALYRTAAGEVSFVYGNVAGPALVASADPKAPAGAAASRPAGTDALPGWSVDETAYPYDMVVMAELGGLALGPLHQVAAVVDGEIRGVARPVRVPALGRTLVFLMVRGAQPRGETVRFQVLDRSTGEVFEVAGTIGFEADAVVGSTAAPLALASSGAVVAHFGLPDAFALAPSQPNPLTGDGVALLRFAVPQEALVSLELFDVNGRRVRALVDERLRPGRYEAEVRGAELRGGVYFVRMRAGAFTATRRLVVVR